MQDKMLAGNAHKPVTDGQTDYILLGPHGDKQTSWEWWCCALQRYLHQATPSFLCWHDSAWESWSDPQAEPVQPADMLKFARLMRLEHFLLWKQKKLQISWWNLQGVTHRLGFLLYSGKGLLWWSPSNQHLAWVSAFYSAYHKQGCWEGRHLI